MSTPRTLGYRLPAEWETQGGVWLSWPTNSATWVGHWEAVQKTFAEMTLKFSKYESVFINLESQFQDQAYGVLKRVGERLGLEAGNVQFFDHATDDAWVRDHGPIYLRHPETGELLITDWQYNAWGGKYPFARDNEVPRLIAGSTGIGRVEESMVLEGGGLETNGVGDLLVTRDCFLNTNRNPSMTKLKIEARLMEGLGVQRVHWLNGCIEGDDTDGHIDNLARFYEPNALLVAGTSERDIANHRPLERLLQECKQLTLSAGGHPEVRVLPLPEPVYVDGKRLPMSYLNFFIGNGAVFVPAYGQPDADAQAVEILNKAFPDRKIEAIDCRTLILEGGGLHCLTQQVPYFS